MTLKHQNATDPVPATNYGVACYARSVGVTAGQTLRLCVQPGQTFRVAFYFQGTTENLSPVANGVPVLVQRLRWVTKIGSTFTSIAISSPQVPDLDWNWPEIEFAIPSSWPSGVYFAVVYPVNASGGATDPLGIAVQSGDPQQQIKPHPDLSGSTPIAWDHGMALFVVRPTASDVIAGAAKIAYVLAVSTYQAYNNTGPGCFYYGNGTSRVTLRRPGCGVGSPVMSEETDAFDTTSKRNTYAHWDARFIRWLAQQNIVCHFYTNYDLDWFQTGLSNPLLKADGTPAYPLMLSVGHDEYWSRAIRNAVEGFQSANGNIAVFSGNTCYRPVGFGAPSPTTSRFDPPTTGIASDTKSVMLRTKDAWPDSLNEASTIGVTFKTGAGSWSPNKVRSNAGYTKVAWWTPTPPGTVVGAAQSLVGYECDALWVGTGPQYSPANFVSVAHADLSDGSQWDQTGKADMGYFQRNTSAPVNKSTLFTMATTDWARFLPLSTSQTDPDMLAVQAMTLAVISRYNAP